MSDNEEIDQNENDTLLNPYAAENGRNNRVILSKEEALDRVGFGLFQILAVIVCTITFILEGYLVYTLTFLLLQPDYECVNKDEEVFSCDRVLTCTKYRAASNGTSEGFYIDYNSSESLHNWIERYGLRCSSPLTIGSFGAVFFMGHLLGSYGLAKYADAYGRIFMLRIAVPLSTVIMGLVVYYSEWFFTTLILFFFFGVFSNIRANVGFIYSQEIVNEDTGKIIGTILNFCDSLAMLGAAFYFKYVSKNWLPLLKFCFYTTLIPAVGIFFLPESPSYLLHKEQYKRAKEVLNWMAKLNCHKELGSNERVREFREKESPSDGEIEQTPEKSEASVDQEDKHYKLSDFFHSWKFLVNLFVMNLCWVASTFNYFLINYYFKYIPGDIYNNVIYAGFAEGLMTAFACLISRVIGAKLTLFVCFMLSGAFGVLLKTYDEDNRNMDWVLFLCVILTKGSISAAYHVCYLATQEFFPVVLSATVFGFCHIFAVMISIVAPIVAELQDPYPMLMFCSFSFVTMVLVPFLKKLQDHRELLNEKP